MKRQIKILFIMGLMLLSCQSNQKILKQDTKLVAPSTFSGIIPCDDCEGINMQINLFEDFIYMLKQTALGKEKENSVSMGKWEFDDSTKILILKNSFQQSKQFILTENEIIEMLDKDGNKIESESNYVLTKEDFFRPITESFQMKGMFRYMADAAMFIECSSQKRFPVAMEKDYINLEKKYLEGDYEGKPALITLSGSIQSRPKMEGKGEILNLIVEKFDKTWPKMDCNSSLSTASLINTYWKLLEIDNKPIEAAKAEREVHFILKADGKSVQGFGGCNNFRGTFTTKENKIGFGPMMSTKKLCKDTMGLENLFLKIFSEANNYKIFGETLELHQDDKILAKFKSVYF